MADACTAVLSLTTPHLRAHIHTRSLPLPPSLLPLQGYEEFEAEHARQAALLIKQQAGARGKKGAAAAKVREGGPVQRSAAAGPPA